MKRLLNIMALFTAVVAVGAAWAAQLLWYSLGNITGGLTAIVASCPDSPKTACAIGALQFVAGVIGAAAGAYGTYYGAFKRDLDGSGVYHIYQRPKWSTRNLKRGQDLGPMLRVHNATNPAKIVMHHQDGRQTKGLYHFNAETRMHHAWADMGLSKSLLSKREVVGGNDGYGGAIHDDDTGTYSNVAHARGDTNEWAQLAFDNMGGYNGGSDSICMGMTDPDNNEQVADVRFQPATNGDYGGLNTDACNGRGWRRRRKRSPSPLPESNGIVCQEECVITKGPATACYNAGGGCRSVNGECAANLNQPEAACDGIWCEPQRVCD